MNALIILLVAIAVLVCGYVFYGGWLAKQWGIDPNRPTPAHEFEDGKDYVPAAPYVVLGHHFSSIAGAGPINGPIQAAIFGWVPVLLWVLIGGIFFGAMHDFGALFASIRHKGQTLATVIAENIDDTAKKLFCIFSYLTLILVVAAFASIVASTFAVAPVPTDDAAKAVAVETGNLANMRTAMISVLFIVVAVIYGVITRGRKIPAAANIVSALAIIVVVVALGYNSAGHRAGQHHLDDPCGPVYPRGLRGPGVDPSAAARLPVELSALRHDRPGACRHHRRRRHGQRRLAGHSRIHRLFRCGWHIQGGCLGLFVPGAVHHHRLRRHLRLPQPRGLGHYLQAARSRGRGAAHRLRRHAARVLGGGHLAVRGGLRVFRLHGRHLRLADPGLRRGPFPDARLRARAGRRGVGRLRAARAGGVGVLPDLARHRDAPGPLHVPGAFHAPRHGGKPTLPVGARCS